MGSGCSGQNLVTNSERIHPHRQGNLTFFIHGNKKLENSVSGKGCRRTVSWHTNLSRQEINIKIKEFWETRVEGKEEVWNLLKHACTIADPLEIENLLKSNGLKMPDGLLQQTYDRQGNKYDLPPFVINKAISYGGVNKDQSTAIVNTSITVIFRSVRFEDCSLKLNSCDLVSDIKSKLYEKLKIMNKLRLFYGGKELKDNVALGNYSIKDRDIVQAFG
jgi:Ubiquitin-binding domain/Ubiquitin family